MKHNYESENYSVSPVGAAYDALKVDRFTLDLETINLIEQLDKFESNKLNNETYDDARTLLFEALTASGHISEIKFSDDLATVNSQILERILRGWSDECVEPEKKRRFAEIQEELLAHKLAEQVQAGLLDTSSMLVTISDFPDNMTREELERTGGYREQNKRGMVRLHYFYYDKGGKLCRAMEQMSRGGSNQDSTHRFLRQYNINLDTTNITESALFNPLIVSRQEFPDGIVDVQRQLDIYGGTIYGENTASKLHVPYEVVREESKRREQQLAVYVKELESFEISLQRSNETEAQKQAKREQKILTILRSICTLAPEYATDCFGAQAARYYTEASDKYAAGDMAGYQVSIEQASHHEEAVSVCGMTITTKPQYNKSQSSNLFGDLLRLTAQAKEKWQWQRGLCRVSECPSRPKTVMVGPCSVCTGCQDHFDHGRQPSRIYRQQRKEIERKKKLKNDKAKTKLGRKSLLSV